MHAEAPLTAVDPLNSKIHPFDTPEGLLMQENEEEIVRACVYARWSRTERVQDRLLGILEGVVLQAKEIAEEMGNEADIQGKRLEALKERADKTNAALATYNEHLLELVRTVRKADRMCLDVVCVLVILGLVGVAVSIFTKRN
jgi:hypothetical protein